MLQGNKEEQPIEKHTWDVLHQVRPRDIWRRRDVLPSPSHWEISY